MAPVSVGAVTSTGAALVWSTKSGISVSADLGGILADWLELLESVVLQPTKIKAVVSPKAHKAKGDFISDQIVMQVAGISITNWLIY